MKSHRNVTILCSEHFDRLSAAQTRPAQAALATFPMTRYISLEQVELVPLQHTSVSNSKADIFNTLSLLSSQLMWRQKGGRKGEKKYPQIKNYQNGSRIPQSSTKANSEGGSSPLNSSWLWAKGRGGEGLWPQTPHQHEVSWKHRRTIQRSQESPGRQHKWKLS